MIWRKHYKSMYKGSLVGAGAIAFAIMGYVISEQEPDGHGNFNVRLNPVLLAATLGEMTTDVQKGIEFLCAPDPHSNSPAEEGRRLIKLGEFDYQVVNGAFYQGLRNADERREQNRLAQERYRERHGKKKK